MNRNYRDYLIYGTCKYKNTQYYKLIIKAIDTHKQIYIKSSRDKQRLRDLRDKILSECDCTEAQLLWYKQKYKTYGKNPREPFIEQYIQLNQYKNGTTKYKIYHGQRSYGVYDSLDEARRVRDMLIRNGWDESISECRVKRRNYDDRYIVCQNGGYIIRRWVDGELVTFDSGIPSLEEARCIRDWWESVGWDWGEV